MESSRLIRKIGLAGGGMALLCLIVGSVALGFGSSLGVLADSNTVNTVNFNDDAIKLRTKDPIRVRDVHSVQPDGWSSGWHEHPGPAIVAVARGSFRIYQGSCDPTTVGAGQAYIETPGVPVLAVAVGETEWTTTLLLPIGEPPATSVDPLCNP
jgi:hypothetical protein